MTGQDIKPANECTYVLVDENIMVHLIELIRQSSMTPNSPITDLEPLRFIERERRCFYAGHYLQIKGMFIANKVRINVDPSDAEFSLINIDGEKPFSC